MNPLDFLYPPECAVCGREGSALCCPDALSRLALDPADRCAVCFFRRQRGHCPKCQGQRIYFDSHRSLYRYESDMRRLIHMWKFENERSVSRLFLSALRQVLNASGADRIGVISAGRRRHRSFFPCGDLLRAAEATGIPCGVDLEKKRIGKNKKQSDQHQAGRYFDVRDSLKLTGHLDGVRNYVVLDDVFTTGATANEAARTLKKAGVVSVHVVTIAMREEVEQPL